MPKLIGHAPSTQNRPARDCQDRRLVQISFAQKRLLPQEQVFYVYDTSDRGGPHSLAKRWYRWYALPETLAMSRAATPNMRAKGLPLCHLTW